MGESVVVPPREPLQPGGWIFFGIFLGAIGGFMLWISGNAKDPTIIALMAWVVLVASGLVSQIGVVGLGVSLGIRHAARPPDA